MRTIHTIMTALDVPARFFFLRHGESEGNVEGKMQGHMDCHLSTLGREQASATAAWFIQSKINVDHVYASPLVRATETAEIVCANAGYPAPESLESALELDTGAFTGLTFPEIKERYPVDYAEFVVGSWESVPDAESIVSLTRRGLDTWERLVKRANEIGATADDRRERSDEPVTILTVTHGGMLQWILKTSFGATPEQPIPWMPLVLASNCAVFSFQARPVRSIDRNENPRSWYYGQWSMMNYTPAAESSPAALARDHFSSGGDQTR